MPVSEKRWLARGVMIHSLDRYYAGTPDRRGFVIGYAAVSSELLELAIRELADQLLR